MIKMFIAKVVRGEDLTENEMLARARAFHDLVVGRRTIRDYSDRPVPREIIEACVTAAGQAEAFRSSTLTALVAGQVMRVPVEESRRVAPGALMVQIDTTEYALAVARARADVLSAEAQFRQMVLFNDQVESEAVRAERERIARSRSGLDQAEVSLREAQLDLARTQVVAPFAGSVADLEVVDGQYVGQNAELLTVVELNPIKVEVLDCD